MPGLLQLFHPYRVVPRHYKQYLQECPYPQLYDSQQQTCRDFWLVDCGERKEAVTPCDYRQFRCTDVTCTPCHRALPSCEGMGDGVQGVGAAGNWSATFVTCRANRTVSLTLCPLDKALLVPRVFSPLSKTCVTLYEVPSQFGGLSPECNGRPNGPYPDQHGRPDLFYICQDDLLTGVYRCPLDKPVYDEMLRACVGQ